MNICTKLCANPSSRCYWWYFTVYMKTLTCWRHYRRSQGNRIHPLGTMNVSIKFICHPSNSSVSVWIKVVDRPTDWQTSGSNIIFHCGQQWNSGKCNLFWEKNSDGNSKNGSLSGGRHTHICTSAFRLVCYFSELRGMNHTCCVGWNSSIFFVVSGHQWISTAQHHISYIRL